MCHAIYLSLTLLLLIYSDYALEQLALSESTGAGEWAMIALGWEILPALWPPLLLMAVIASAVTFLATRGFTRNR